MYITSAVVGLALGAGGCGEGSVQPVVGHKEVPAGMLAIVGEEGIDGGELRRFEESIQPVHRSQAKGVARHREHLLSLIDIKLMVREAEARGLDRDPELEAALQQQERKAMIEAYLHAAVGQNILITEEELRQSFNRHPARFAVKGAHILVRTRARADSLYALIQSGRRSFEELARQYSLDRETAARGGAFATYYAFDRVSDRVYKEVFSMDIGQVSRPFRTGQGWELAKVVDKKLLPYEKYRPVIQRATAMEKFNRLKAAHIDSLQYRLGLRPHVENLRAFIAAWNQSPGRPDLSPGQFAAPLYTFDGGQLTLEQAMYLLINTGLGKTTVDSALVDERVRRRGAPDMLLAAMARRQGFDRRPGVREKVAHERERRLLEALWNEVLEDEIEVGDEEARAHYEAHPGYYKVPAEIVVQEILVADRLHAGELLAQIEAGADMGDLATRFSLRRHAGENGGMYAMRAFERVLYGELMDAALEAPIGQVMGPIEIDRPLPAVLGRPAELERAYSIFKVLERLPERVQSFEMSRERARFFARQEKQQKRLAELNEQLRRKYMDEWGIDEAALEEYARAVAGG